jgi:hypothetical protein
MFVYNFLAGCKETGHLILDDTYWVGYFKNKLKGLYSSEFSISIQRQKFSFYENKFHIIYRNKNRLYLLDSILRCFAVPLPRNSDILIQGFEELPILFFLLRAKFLGNKIYLVLTNNICTYRINPNRYILKGILKIIFKLSNKVIYHTDFELMLINKYLKPGKATKFEFVKYQLLTKDLQCENYKIPFVGNKCISFFGPIKRDKPIEPFLDLVKADKEKKFSYKIFNPGEKHVDDIIKKINDNQNVEVVNQFLSFEEYEKAVKESAIIFLSHDFTYEGKLSGNICDCISKRKPFISNNISPVKDFVVEYGQIGFVYDLENDSTWTLTFLKSIDEEKYNGVLKNLERLQSEFTDEKIKQELDLVFSE